MIVFCNLNLHLLTNLGGRGTGINRTALLTSSLLGQSLERNGRRQKVSKILPYPKQDVYAMRSIKQPEKGRIYDKKPFKFYCEKGKTYFWCTCGFSRTQPFCDGHHKIPHFRIKLQPLAFYCTESKEYWFCNCKQTEQRPFCDGTHRQQHIQEAVKS